MPPRTHGSGHSGHAGNTRLPADPAWEDYTGKDFFSHDAKIAADDRLEAGIHEACDASCDWAAAIYGWAVRNFGT